MTLFFRIVQLQSKYNFFHWLFFFAYTEHPMIQISIMALISVHMHRILWLNARIAEPTCKLYLRHMPFQERCPFGERLDILIQEFASGKICFLRENK